MNQQTRILSVLFFITLFLLPRGACSQSDQDRDYDPGFFPFSVWYSGGKARAPMLSEITPESREEWRRDLQQIRQLGFNTVRTWVEWMTVEPRRGEYHFENLHLLMELAGEAGLKVFIQMYADSAPDWVAQEFPGALFKTQSGAVVMPQAAPGACTDNLPVRQAVLDFYTRTAEEASGYDHFFGWDLWSEPHIINWANVDYVPNVQFCYCEGTQNRFRDWLKEKYGSLEFLNRAWHRSFTEWHHVSPPRFSTILSYTDFIDWKTFIYDKLVEDMAMRYEAVRKADPDNVITAHAVGASLFQSPYVGAGATDDFLMARPLDYYGVSLYPKHNHPDRHWSLTTLGTVMDFTRSANREKGGWYVGELQAGHGQIGLLTGDPITPDDHRLWIWSAIAKGAKSINIYAYYPMSSGYESGGYGLINLDGTLTERAVHAGEIASLVNEHQELFLKARPVDARIGIVYNPLSQMVGGMQRRDYPGAHTNSLIGYYRAFADHNIPVDFVHRQHLERNELDSYQLIIVPWPVMFTEEAAAGLKRFVRNGGHVLAEARLAWNDESGHASKIIPGMGLHKVFGVREHEVRMYESQGIPITSTNQDHPAMKGIPKEEALTGWLYAMSMVPLQGNKVDIMGVFEDGNTALVSARYGEGEAIIAGTFLGAANHPVPDPANEQFFLNLLDWAGVKRPLATTHDGNTSSPVRVRLQKHPQAWLLFLMNHGMTNEQVGVDLQLRDGYYILHELLSGQASSGVSSEHRLLLRSELAPKGVQVWKIQPGTNRK